MLKTKIISSLDKCFLDSGYGDFDEINRINIYRNTNAAFQLLPYDDEEERRMSMIFCVDGIVGMIREWILSGFRWPVERISSLIVDIAFRSVGFDHDKGFGSRKLRHS